MGTRPIFTMRVLERILVALSVSLVCLAQDSDVPPAMVAYLSEVDSTSGIMEGQLANCNGDKACQTLVLKEAVEHEKGKIFPGKLDECLAKKQKLVERTDEQKDEVAEVQMVLVNVKGSLKALETGKPYIDVKREVSLNKQLTSTYGMKKQKPAPKKEPEPKVLMTAARCESEVEQLQVEVIRNSNTKK